MHRARAVIFVLGLVYITIVAQRGSQCRWNVETEAQSGRLPTVSLPWNLELLWHIRGRNQHVLLAHYVCTQVTDGWKAMEAKVMNRDDMSNSNWCDSCSANDSSKVTTIQLARHQDMLEAVLRAMRMTDRNLSVISAMQVWIDMSTAHWWQLLLLEKLIRVQKPGTRVTDPTSDKVFEWFMVAHVHRSLDIPD